MPSRKARPPRPGSPPWCRRIYARREEELHLSQTECARRIGITQSAWAAIEQGEKHLGGGVTVPFRGSDETVAEMYQLLGLSPGDLAADGRREAAEVLGSLLGLPRSVAARAVIAKAAEAVAEAVGVNSGAAEEIRDAIRDAVDRVTAHPR